MSTPRILAFAGSTRKESFNRKLLGVAIAAAKDAGIDVDHVELSDYPIPIFNQDEEDEHGQHPNATQLRRKLEAADGLLLACPEYNGSVTPLMKNVVDWLSRGEQGGSGVEAYRGKAALLVGASPGRLGASRAMEHLSSILGNLGVEVGPERFSLPGAGDAFDASGRLVDTERQSELDQMIGEFARRAGSRNADT